jgi:hypothetical protein
MRATYRETGIRRFCPRRQSASCQIKTSEWTTWLQSQSWFIHGEEKLAENFPLVVEYLLKPEAYVPWWNEYPGMHIPAPVEIGSALPSDMMDRSRGILALTKMNWNSSDGISRLPITLLFARRVGELMAELSDNATPKPSYRFYI